MKQLFVLFITTIVLAMLGKELLARKSVYVPSLGQFVTVYHDDIIVSGDTTQLVRVLNQRVGSYDIKWRVLDENLGLDTLMEKALFEKQNPWPDEDPLTKGTLEYRVGVWK